MDPIVIPDGMQFVPTELLPNLIAKSIAKDRYSLTVDADLDAGDIALMRAVIAEEHKKALEALIEKGELRAFSGISKVPSNTYEGSEISIDELKRYLEPIGIGLRFGVDADGARPVENQRGLTKKQITAVEWPLSGTFTQESLSRALSDVPQWLKDARLSKGAAGKDSSTWNVALLAACLAEKHYATRSALKAHIRDHFPEWLDAWQEIEER